MNIRDALVTEHSKRQTTAIVNYIDGDPTRFRELMGLFLGPVYRVSQRAAWAVSYCIEHDPHLVKPYFKRLIEQLENEDSHVAVRRNVARLLQFVEIPKRFEGRIFDACYNLTDDPKQPVALRVFAMTVAANIAKNEPELLAELRTMVNKYSSHMSAGFRGRARLVLGTS